MQPKSCYILLNCFLYSSRISHRRICQWELLSSLNVSMIALNHENENRNWTISISPSPLFLSLFLSLSLSFSLFLSLTQFLSFNFFYFFKVLAVGNFLQKPTTEASQGCFPPENTRAQWICTISSEIWNQLKRWFLVIKNKKTLSLI